MALDSFKRAHLLNISGPIFRGTPTEASQWVRPSGRIDLIPFVTLATPILPFHLSWHKCLEEDQLRKSDHCQFFTSLLFLHMK